jgi:hypothetical protein
MTETRMIQWPLQLAPLTKHRFSRCSAAITCRVQASRSAWLAPAGPKVSAS